ATPALAAALVALGALAYPRLLVPFEATFCSSRFTARMPQLLLFALFAGIVLAVVRVGVLWLDWRGLLRSLCARLDAPDFQALPERLRRTVAAPLDDITFAEWREARAAVTTRPA